MRSFAPFILRSLLVIVVPYAELGASPHFSLVSYVCLCGAAPLDKHNFSFASRD